MGWMVFKDANGNEQLDEEDAAFCGTSGNCVIGVFPALPQGFTIRTGTNINKFVAFEPDGSASANGTFRLCLDADQGNARSIIVIMSGRVRSEKGDSCQ
jgi:Tfp pilus assembly protein FimT